ncbi:RNA polymerase sigma-B factor [Nocardioides albertanoniae]|uniref:RNA polymerase sigma-B factor n=1 Tax=Nocardioides albertanoniae TaxID=1175486 RepID=A0A543A8M2_9ACTN|nr:sigma-70 family RNA polymerase sigma factor [Nocardioides albertanoniae]TQL68925.1 RNA polymerase sigma-B factor [Nocardioides albertanoniae]
MTNTQAATEPGIEPGPRCDTEVFENDMPRAERQELTSELLERADHTEGEERDDLVGEVILLNAVVARSIARRYAGRGIAQADLEQVAYVALVRAAKGFHPDRADDFLTYAVPTIRGEVKRWFRDHGWTVRPPRPVQELQGTLLRIGSERGSLPVSELAEVAHVPEQRVREALDARGCFTPTSLDAPLRAGGQSDSGGATIGDMLPDVDGSLASCETRLALEQAVHTLCPRDQQVVRLRFLEDHSQAEIGEAIGVTQTQVSRILARVLEELRGTLADAGFAA